MKFTSVKEAQEYLEACHHMRNNLIDEEMEIGNRIEEITQKINEAQMWLRTNANKETK